MSRSAHADEASMELAQFRCQILLLATQPALSSCHIHLLHYDSSGFGSFLPFFGMVAVGFKIY